MPPKKRKQESGEQASPRSKRGKSAAADGTPPRRQPGASGRKRPTLTRKDSFEPTNSGGAAAFDDSSCGAELPPAHTLICGTSPGDASLEVNEYYAQRTNAFWWIVGDAFGHQPTRPQCKTQGPPANFSLLASSIALRSYAEQMAELRRRGYVLWNVLKTCKRTGSSDAAIAKLSERPNDIESWCKRHPTVKRICLASGKTTAAKFARHNQSWLKQDEASVTSLVLADSAATLECFSKENLGHLLPETRTAVDTRITLAVMYSTSRAACNPDNPGGE